MNAFLNWGSAPRRSLLTECQAQDAVHEGEVSSVQLVEPVDGIRVEVRVVEEVGRVLLHAVDDEAEGDRVGQVDVRVIGRHFDGEVHVQGVLQAVVLWKSVTL